MRIEHRDAYSKEILYFNEQLENLLKQFQSFLLNFNFQRAAAQHHQQLFCPVSLALGKA